MEQRTPKLMTIRQAARTGILPEHALRALIKAGSISAVYVGKRAYINYDTLCRQLGKLGEADFQPTRSNPDVRKFSGVKGERG